MDETVTSFLSQPNGAVPARRKLVHRDSRFVERLTHELPQHHANPTLEAFEGFISLSATYSWSNRASSSLGR